MERGGLGPSSDSDFIEDDPANAMKLRQRVKLLELELKRIRTHLANARTRRDQLYSGAGVEAEGEEVWGDGPVKSLPSLRWGYVIVDYILIFVYIDRSLHRSACKI